jgi:hypothetical protein
MSTGSRCLESNVRLLLFNDSKLKKRGGSEGVGNTGFVRDNAQLQLGYGDGIFIDVYSTRRCEGGAART